MNLDQLLEKKKIIPCLSINQPWCWLIASGHKGIENRNWTTGYRGWVLLHASKKMDLDWFYPRGYGEDTGKLYKGKAARFGLAGIMPDHRSKYPTGCIVGIAHLDDVVTWSESVWFNESSRYGFVLSQAHTLAPIPYQGALNLFGVPISVVEHAIKDILQTSNPTEVVGNEKGI
jgi:hypothetical protein